MTPSSDERSLAFGLVEAGRFADAVEPLRRALLRTPRDVALLSGLAEALFRSGRVREAVARMRQRSKLAPDTPGFHYELARALMQIGDARDALRELEHAVRLAPRFVAARIDLARLHLHNGSLTDAEGHFRAAMAADPLWSAPRAGLATVRLAQRRSDEAIVLFREALARDAGDVESANALGVALMDAGRLSEAIDCLVAAVDTTPTHVTSRINLGLARRLTGALDDAVRVHRAVTLEFPDAAAAWDALAQDLAMLDDLDGAVAAAREAVARKPAEAVFHAHLGNLLAEAGRCDAAIASYRDALRRAPTLAIARWNLALAELAVGDFKAGWTDYEARWSCAEFPSPRRDFGVPRLTSLADARGRTVLVHAEQGFGDTLQFIRFVPRLVASGATVVVSVPPALERLLDGMPDIGAVVATDEAKPPLGRPFERHIPMLSLPLLLGAWHPTGDAVPYLTAPRRDDGDARATRPRVGVVWAGGAQHVADRRRSLRLEQIAPWLARDDVEWIGLQKEIPLRDSALFAQRALDRPTLARGQAVADFADTADIVATLDLVITVDTAVAHLAGAMGRPVWILLPRVPDFRWLLAGDTTDWYPSARLFRMRDGDDWTAVVDDVSTALDAWIAAGCGN